MYEVFYNLRAEPFRLSPDHKFCYEHNSYAKARAYLAYAFKRAEGFVMITGRPGTGKTTLVGELVESLERDRVAVANLVCTQLQADELLKSVAFSFGIGSQRADKAELLQRLNVLFQRWHREGRRALLVVDEAQDLSSSAMEELRLLTNIQLGGQPLLQIFLLGQPELQDLILSPEMEQVHQRIVAATHIQGLEADETEAYVLHRLQVVGWRGDPAIDRAIFPAIHKFSEGVPRRINLICSRLFLLGSVEQRHAIGIEDVRVVIGELQAENLAAGTTVSAEDFVAHGETQWVPVPVESEQEQDRPEVYLHAVNSESFPSADGGSAAPNAGAKKKDPPFVTTDRQIAQDSDSPGLKKSGTGDDAQAEDEPEEVFTPDFPVAAAKPSRKTGVENNGSNTERHGRGTAPRSGWSRAIALCLFVLSVIALLFFLELFASRPDRSVYEGLDLPSAGDVIHSQPPAQTALKSDANIMPLEDVGSGEQFAEHVEFSDSAVEASSPAPAGEMQEQQITQELVSRSDSMVSSEDVTQNSLPEIADPPDRFGLPAPDLPAPDLSPVEGGMQQARDSHPNEVSQQAFLVTFSFDSIDPLEESQPVLESVAAWLLENPENSASITGYADSQGDKIYNLSLSRMRAEAVEEYLVGEGVARQRLQVEGMGAFSPAAENPAPDLNADMEQYRVVQIVIADDFQQ